MNRLAADKRVRIVSALVEGVGINAVCRMTGAAKHTVLKLLEDLGCAAAAYHHRYVRNLKVRRLQADEIWAFCGAKAKNATLEQRSSGWGDVWTWVAIDADTKLVVSYLVGGRSTGWAVDFMQDCRERIIGNPQITTDAHKPYLKAVEEAFGGDANYATMHKVYGYTEAPDSRYSPATCIGCDMKTVSGVPDPKHVSTSFVERQNLTMRMSMRRFTRLTNGFSKKLENHGHAVALNFMHYNFCRVHKTLRVTPAMEAGLTDHVWTLEELVGLSTVNYSSLRSLNGGTINPCHYPRNPQITAESPKLCKFSPAGRSSYQARTFPAVSTDQSGQRNFSFSGSPLVVNRNAVQPSGDQQCQGSIRGTQRVRVKPFTTTTLPAPRATTSKAITLHKVLAVGLSAPTVSGSTPLDANPSERRSSPSRGR